MPGGLLKDPATRRIRAGVGKEAVREFLVQLGADGCGIFQGKGPAEGGKRRRRKVRLEE